jgi:hypothetical protein
VLSESGEVPADQESQMRTAMGDLLDKINTDLYKEARIHQSMMSLTKKGEEKIREMIQVELAEEKLLGKATQEFEKIKQFKDIAELGNPRYENDQFRKALQNFSKLIYSNAEIVAAINHFADTTIFLLAKINNSHPGHLQFNRRSEILALTDAIRENHAELKVEKDQPEINQKIGGAIDAIGNLLYEEERIREAVKVLIERDKDRFKDIIGLEVEESEDLSDVKKIVANLKSEIDDCWNNNFGHDLLILKQLITNSNRLFKALKHLAQKVQDDLTNIVENLKREENPGQN